MSVGARTVTLTDFLLARIAEDEMEVASQECGCDLTYNGTHHPSCMEHVLAECDAKRRIVGMADEATGLDMQVDGEFRVGARDMLAEPFLGDVMLRALALPYADHPDFRDEWRL